jgi:3-dehydroquinate synthase
MIHTPVLFYQVEAESYLRSLDSIAEYSQLFVLTDENTHTHCLPLLKGLLGDQSYTEIQILSGEVNKTISNCEYIWSQLTAYQADRSALVLLLGGGVLTDMGAFAASCF